MSFGLNPLDGRAGGFGGNTNSHQSAVIVDSSTPWTAIAEGNLTWLQQSLEQLQYPVSVADEVQGYTLLQAAASYNQSHILNWLWSQIMLLNNDTNGVHHVSCPHGGWQNAVDFDGDTALHYAGSVESMKFLIDVANINIHVKNTSGMTALDTKRTEMNEMEQDEDEFDEDDVEYKQLKDIVQFLESIIMNPQQ
jgi:Ankyrin repeat